MKVLSDKEHRDLDARVAIRCLGWKPPERTDANPDGEGLWPSYSTSIAAAWILTDRLGEFTLHRLADDVWECESDFSEFYGIGPSVEVAICRAAIDRVTVNDSEAE